MSLFFLSNLVFLLGQSSTELDLVCKPIGAAELILIIGLLSGLVTLIWTAPINPITITVVSGFFKISLPVVITKIIAALGIGASMTTILVPLQPFFDVIAVKAVVDSIQAILECHAP